MKQIIIILALAAFCISFSACNGGKKADSAKKEMKSEVKGPEYTSKYICPMYCKGSGSHEMGTCPVCKMDLELNEEYKGDDADSHEGHDHGDHDNHNHGGDHEGHDHDSHEGHNH